MKTLYALSGSLIVVLALAAFNPGTVVDMYEVAKIRLVEMPRAIEQLNQRMDAAEDGDMAGLHFIAWYHLSPSKWHVPAYYEDVLGPKDREKGAAMMREAAAAGHPEALYYVARVIGDDEEVFREALRAGSSRAVREVHWQLLEDPCDRTANEYMNEVRERLDDPAYPWISPDTPNLAQDMRDKWKAGLLEDLEALDSLRAETCTPAG